MDRLALTRAASAYSIPWNQNKTGGKCRNSRSELRSDGWLKRAPPKSEAGIRGDGCRPRFRVYTKLELEAQFERQNTRPSVTGVLPGGCIGVGAGGGIESERTADAAEFRMVENAESLHPEFEHTLLTADGNRLRERGVEVDPPRTVHDVGTGVSDGADGRYCKRRWIEGQFAIGQRRIGGNIGEGVAHHVDTGTLIGGSGDILAVRRAETRGEGAAAVGGGNTRDLPVIRDCAEV